MEESKRWFGTIVYKQKQTTKGFLVDKIFCDENNIRASASNILTQSDDDDDSSC